jgi:hypothetical protein
MNPALHAAHAAAQQRAADEENKLTPYSSADLNGWEFKIVRSNTNRFKNPEHLRLLCIEEAGNGWELLEKFDSSRIRFKRRTERRSINNSGRIDPYRTSVGITEGMIAVIVIGSIALVIGVVLLVTQVLR